MKKEFDSEPIYSKRCLKTKTKAYGNEATDFLVKEILKVGPNCSCLAVILTYCVFKKNENYYLQVFIKECEYIEKEKR